MSEIERRAQDKFQAAIFRRRLVLQIRLREQMRAAAEHLETAQRNISDRQGAADMAAMARQARRDGLADITEIRREAEQQWSNGHAASY